MCWGLRGAPTRASRVETPLGICAHGKPGLAGGKGMLINKVVIPRAELLNEMI
ncbi:MAG: hypothetical protein ABSH00_05310 [Bryobacteraceae bacterium]